MPATLGRYELITEIGRGGMADVHLALQRGPAGFEKLVVLKLVHEELASQQRVVDMLLDEAKLAALIKHPNVVDVYELGQEDGRYFIAMEYLEGEPLLAVLEQGHEGKRLDPLSMARIAADTAEGLDAAHQLKTRDGKALGLVHHDVSLGNIFVLYSGQVKLLDFGVAKASRTAARTDEVFGKLAYMAPEKLDERPGDRRSDIWSLGCVLWESLTLKRLFKGANDTELIREVRYVNIPAPSSINHDVPVELDAIVHKALQRDPFRRYQTAKEFGAALEEVLTAKSYPSKNFKIAGYMMATFVDRIAAREQLLRDLSGETRPSAEVIDAAFGETAVRKESTLPSIDHLLNPSAVVVLPSDHTGADPIAPSGPHRAPPELAAARFEPNVRVAEETVELEDLEPIDAVRAARSRRDATHVERGRQRLALAIGGGVLLVLVIALISQCGGDAPPRTAALTPLSSPLSPPRSGAAATPGVGVDVDVPGTRPAEVASDEIEMFPEDTAETGSADQPDAAPDAEPDDDAPTKRPRPTRSAQQLYLAGLAAWKKKDVDKAYALFTDGRRANSRYAPNWFGIGMIHEKRGRIAAAKTAYRRYLVLDPRARNAKALRKHLDKL